MHRAAWSRGAAGAGAGVRLRAAALPPAVIILRGVDAFTGVSNGELAARAVWMRMVVSGMAMSG